jgi:Mg-chelatase subunit ChlD
MDATLFKLNNSAKCGNYTHFLQLKASITSERTPIHIIALIDISGSMQFDNKLENVKKSLTAVLEFMNSTDMLSIITFSRDSLIISNKTLTTPENKYIISQTIAKMDVDCSTNLSSGLFSAFECQRTPQHKTSILLLTDGEANEGITNPDSLIEIIRQQCDTGVNIYTFGYGSEHNSALLSMIAQEKDGAYNVVNSLENVASAIGSAFGSIASCIAQNVAIEGAQFYSGFPETQHGGVRVGDVVSGGEIGVLVKNIDDISIKGYMVTNGFSAFNLTDDAIHKEDANEEIDKAAYITYMRIKLAGFIENGASDDALRDFERKLDGNDDIIKIMRKEVQEMRLKNKLKFQEEDAAIYTQHANFYKNLRSEYANAPRRSGYGDSRGFSVMSPEVKRVANNIFRSATRARDDDSDDEAKRSDPSDNIITMHSESSVGN